MQAHKGIARTAATLIGGAALAMLGMPSTALTSPTGAIATDTFDCQTAVPAAPDGVELASAVRGVGTPSIADAARLVRLQQSLAQAHFEGGAGFRIECRGNRPDTGRSVTWHFTLKQLERIATVRGETSLTAFEHRYRVEAPRALRLVDDVLVAEVMTLPEPQDWHVDSAANALVARHVYRRAGAGCSTLTSRCSVRQDVDWRLDLAGRDLRLTRSVWTNGVASGQAVWRLER